MKVKVTLSVSNGVLTLSGIAGLSFSVGDGSADASMTFTGSIANINTALDGLSYLPGANYNGSDTLSITTNDQGNTGSGGAKSDTDTVAITVNAVNDAPVATITPTTYAATEQTSLSLAGTGIAISDVDAGSASMTATLSVTSGTLSVAAGTTGAGVSGSGTNTLTLTGTITQINNLLAGSGSATLSYVINSDTPPASDTLTLLVNDNGNTGSGGALTGSDSATINIAAVNDAPVNTVPGAQSINEDNTLTFSTGNGNLIAVTDVDAASGSLRVTLSVANGTLTLAGVSGLTFSTGDGTADASMTFTGTLANINAALDGLVYVPAANFNGSDTLTLVTNDQGNTGSGGAKSDTDTVTINIAPVNDAPVANDDAISTAPGTPLDIDVKANDQDVDNTLASLTVTVLSSSAGTSATVNPDGTIHFDPGATSGTQTITYRLTDPGSLQSNVATVTINVAANTPPDSTDSSATINEDTSYTFSAGDFAFNDPDNPGAAQTLASVRIDTLPGAGSLKLSGVAVTSGQTIAAASLGSLVFTPAANANGIGYASFTFSVQDNLGAFDTSPNTFTVNVTAVNDAPVNTVPAAQSTNEDTALVFSAGGGNALSIADVDAGGASVQVTLSVANGVLTLSGTTGLSFSVGDGSADASMTFTGSIANINSALDGLSYLPGANYNGSDTLSLTTNDQGNTGSGGAKSDTDTVAITVNAVNDAPVATITPTTYAATEQTSLSLAGTGIAISDVDAGGKVALTVNIVSSPAARSLSRAGTTGAGVSGSGTNTLTLTGTITQINNLLAGSGSATLSYVINSDTPPASDTLSVLVNDNGNTGSGGALTGLPDSATINIAARSMMRRSPRDHPDDVFSNRANFALVEGTGIAILGCGWQAAVAVTATLSRHQRYFVGLCRHDRCGCFGLGHQHADPHRHAHADQ